MPLSAPVLGGGGGSSTTNVNIGQNSADTFNNTYITEIYATQVVLQTTALGPNQRFTGAVQMANSFQLLGVAADSPCRVQIYGSLAAQLADAARGIDVPPPAGVFQSLITDIVVDTLPYQWVFQSRVGANSEEPASNYVYFTITNVDAKTDTITMTCQFVALATGLGPAPGVTLGNSPPISNTLLASLDDYAKLSGSQFSGPVSANQLTATSVTATTVDTVNIAATGSVVVTDLDIGGTLTAVDLDVSGSAALTGASASSISSVNITSTGSVDSNILSASSITTASFTATGSTVVNDLTGTSVNVSEVISNSVNSPIVNISGGGGASGLQVNGVQVSSSSLSDAANLPLLNGANVFTQPLTAATIQTTDGGSVSVLSGPVQVASISTTDGSSVSTFLGPVQSASFTQASGSSSSNTFLGDVNVVDVYITGNADLVTINGTDQSNIGANANNTADHVLNTLELGTTSGPFISTTPALIPEMVTTVSCEGASDAFLILFKSNYTAGSGAFIQAQIYVDGSPVSGSTAGIMADVAGHVGLIACDFVVTGLAAGSHTIGIYGWTNDPPSTDTWYSTWRTMICQRVF